MGPPKKIAGPLKGTRSGRNDTTKRRGPLGRDEESKAVPRELESLALDLVQLAFDLAGFFDPTPVSDGASALISLARGQWLDAAISGVSMIPYVGDLAKAGKLPKYAASVKKAVELAEKSTAVARHLMEPMKKLRAAIDLLPKGTNKYLDEISDAVESFIKKHGVKRLEQRLPDISNSFVYRTYEEGGRVIKEASGRLGVPGKVRSFRKAEPQAEKYARQKVSSKSGDHAGHLIGDQFGANAGKASDRGLGSDNLSLQNAKMNSNGTWYKLEEEWADKLKQGYGYEVTVQDFYRKGETRPYKRKVTGFEIDPTGVRKKFNAEDEMGQVIYGNFETEASRQAKRK